MPTVLRAKGYRFSFYSYDLREPIHVHVTKDGHEAKVWMQPTAVAWNRGFRDHQIREVMEILESNRQLIETTWNERSGN
jgi:ribosome-binding factor A